MRLHARAIKPLSFAAVGLSVALLVPGCHIEQDLSVGETGKFLRAPDNSAIPGQYIVVFHDGEVAASATGGYDTAVAHARATAAAVLADHGVSASAIGHAYGTAVRGFAVRLSDGELHGLLSDPRVRYVEQDQRVSIDAPPCHVTNTCDDDGGGGGNQDVPYGITRVGGAVNHSGSGRAWVIDSGVDLDHEDLNVDVGRSADFTGKNNPDDENGHGTHVAGTIAAIDNSVGVVGVAAGAPVVAVRVLDRRGSGTISGVIAGVDYVAASASNGDVANMSLGGGASSALDDAVKSCASSGVKMAIAAGNSGAHAGGFSPARAEHNNIYTVSAIDSSDRFASFSNFGNPPVDYAAPGVSVLSTYKNNGYSTLSGTSMAAPHVAGVLLASGSVRTDGHAINDPDGNPDPIAHR